MKLLVESIRNAVEKDCLIPALMSSLTIPDAMGQLLYPNLVLHNGKRAAGRQYVKWFDDWVANDFLFSGDPSNEDETIPGQIINGKMCWKLRCSLLHSGDYDVLVDAPEKDESFDYDYKFELVLHGCNALCSSWPSPKSGMRATKSVTFRVDVASSRARCATPRRPVLKKRAKRSVTPIWSYSTWLHGRIDSILAEPSRQTPCVLNVGVGAPEKGCGQRLESSATTLRR